MKSACKKGLFAAAAILIIGVAEPVPAEGPHNVSNTPHNLSASAPVFMYASKDEDEVCIFCHTPHGGSLVAPLWNRDPSSSTFTHYNSATISTEIALEHTSQNIYDESMLCLSCHDGTVSMYDVINFSNRTGNDPTPPDGIPGGMMFDLGFFGGGPLLGTDLSDDHPVSFSYDSAYGDITNLGTLQDPLYATNEGIKFFGATNRVECSSCHDPHVDYLVDTTYQPFLRMSNSQSKMCLACHIK